VEPLMKPRRWYSSPEVNPHPRCLDKPPMPDQRSFTYAARARSQEGPVLKWRTGLSLCAFLLTSAQRQTTMGRMKSREHANGGFADTAAPGDHP
jgi:hypothetical protein